MLSVSGPPAECLGGLLKSGAMRDASKPADGSEAGQASLYRAEASFGDLFSHSWWKPTYTGITWPEDTAPQGCDRSADRGASMCGAATPPRGMRLILVRRIGVGGSTTPIVCLGFASITPDDTRLYRRYRCQCTEEVLSALAFRLCESRTQYRMSRHTRSKTEKKGMRRTLSD